MAETISSREMRALELNSEYFGVSRLQLMENAGKGVAEEVAARFRPNTTKVVVFCGLGGNGGDGFVAVRHLAYLGFKVEVALAGKSADISDAEAKANFAALQWLKDTIPVHEVYDSSLIPRFEADVIVDALLGIGLKGAPRPPILQIIRNINQMKCFRVAVDVPTGIDSDTGAVLGEAVKADLTVTFHKLKPGLKTARKQAGKVALKSIGLPKEIERFAGPGDVQLVVKPRRLEAHKGEFGRLLIIGGSETYSGAPVFVASAALRTGVDLAYVAAPSKTAYAISSMSPDLITIKLEDSHLAPKDVAVIKPYLTNVTAVAIGPGLGLHKETKTAVKEIIRLVEKSRIPLLLDADGLKAFAESKRKFTVPAVLTPHAGEYEILTGKELPDELDEKIAHVQKMAEDLGAVVLLKGNVDVIADKKQVKLNFTGNPGMTVGGTGDVLSGIVAAFLAQGAEAFEAAVAGAFVNGAAGDFVKAEKGFHMVASDLIDWIPRVIDDPMSHMKVRGTR
jgi:NAD(P)H-hydrate epimerase